RIERASGDVADAVADAGRQRTPDAEIDAVQLAERVGRTEPGHARDEDDAARHEQSGGVDRREQDERHQHLYARSLAVDRLDAALRDRCVHAVLPSWVLRPPSAGSAAILHRRASGQAL